MNAIGIRREISVKKLHAPYSFSDTTPPFFCPHYNVTFLPLFLLFTKNGRNVNKFVKKLHALFL